MQVSHGSLYGFYSIYLSELGFLDSSIGVQWAVAAGSEVLVFFFAARIVGGISHQLLFSGCLILAVIRWTLVFATQSYAWLTLTQCLHAFTFGVFHITSMKLIQKMFPKDPVPWARRSTAPVAAALARLLDSCLQGICGTDFAGNIPDQQWHCLSCFSFPCSF
jgi:hypothetical protein